MHFLHIVLMCPPILAATVGSCQGSSMQDVLEGKHYNFPKQEEQVLQLWQDIDAFKEQLRRTEGKKPYVFYDGPPFATGLPHYGHLLAGTLKVGTTWHAQCSLCVARPEGCIIHLPGNGLLRPASTDHCLRRGASARLMLKTDASSLMCRTS